MKEFARFQTLILRHYEQNKRSFPWRETADPYAILVSEMMLQQTQAERVVPKFTAFLNAFPSVHSLSNAPLREVIQLWSGLGYNRRVKYLHESAKIIVRDNQGKVPKEKEALESLPGIGPYTAAAIQVFAFNIPSLVIETNIRAVYIHFFFSDSEVVNDIELLPLIEKTMDRKNPREWYNALMDYGAMLKSSGVNPSRKSKTYSKQSAFKGSKRQVRGAVLKFLSSHDSSSVKSVLKALPFDEKRVKEVLNDLDSEALIEIDTDVVKLPS